MKDEGQIHSSVYYGISEICDKFYELDIKKEMDDGLLTEEALYVFRAAVLGPVGVLQVPHGPLLTRQQVLDL